MPFPIRRLLLATALLAAATSSGAQVGTGRLPPGDPPRPDGTRPDAAAGADPRSVAQRAQREFEAIRRKNLDSYDGKVPLGRQCQEPVGMACYWYDPDGAMPRDQPEVVVARDNLLKLLDSLGTLQPGDNWISGTRVRYLVQAERPQEALAVAETCTTVGWWCDGLKGYALHELRRYAEAEAAFERVLAELTPRERCRWRDLTPYLDDDTRRQYIRTECGTPERDAYEARVWWYSRNRYGLEGNDSRTEHFARLIHVEMMRDAVLPSGEWFDEAQREITLRFGWSRRYARDDAPTFSFGARNTGVVSVIGSEAVPAYRFIPPSHVITSPAASDSLDWAVQRPPVVGRYAPKYAKRLFMLEHQQGLFRRGDTALVVLAYDVSKVPGLDSATLEGALTLTPGTTPRWSGTVVKDVPAKGTMTVKAPWGPLLMSAEIVADSAATLVRARYGIRPPFAIGRRVSLSDLLFFVPFGEPPTTVEQALPHALATQKVRSSQKLGVYWEAYNTNPAGERMTVSLVVAPETDEDARGSLLGRALRRSRTSSPVSVTIEDVSARGSSMSPRSLEIDISTLRPGAYLVQLEIDVAGQYTVRADRRLVVIDP